MTRVRSPAAVAGAAPSRGTRGMSPASLPAKAEGFSMVEILVVLAIIGLILSIAVPGYLRSVERARQARAMEELARWSDVLIRKYNGNYPPALDMMAVGREIEADARDPWKHAYVYRGEPSGDRFELRSLGRDGRPSAGITYETRNQFDLDIIMVSGVFTNKPIE